MQTPSASRSLYTLSFFILAFLAFQALVHAGTPTRTLFSDSLGSGVYLQTNTPRAHCSIEDDPAAPQGSKIIRVSTTEYLANGDYCGLFFTDYEDLSAYTEIEFWLRTSSPDSFFTLAMNSSSQIQSVGIRTVGDWRRYRFPLPNTFSSIDFTSVISAMVIQPQLGSDEWIEVDNIRLRSRSFFPIFSDATQPGREEIQPGGDECLIAPTSYAPEGNHYFKMAAATWSCRFFFHDPRFDLTGFNFLRFWIRSWEDVRVEIQTASSTGGLVVPSTNGDWKRVILPISDFGSLDLSEVLAPFIISRASSNNNSQRTVFVDNIQYLNAPLVLTYFNDFENASLVGDEWSDTRTDITPAGSRNFLGSFFRENVSLSFDNLPSHSLVKISFDLYIMLTWDGNNAIVGPDVWNLSVENGPVLLRATFSNDAEPFLPEFNQSYPDFFPEGSNHGLTGASEVNTLGYPDNSGTGNFGAGDSVYHLEFFFPHRSPFLRFFFGTEERRDANEPWGLDNVRVEVFSI